MVRKLTFSLLIFLLFLLLCEGGARLVESSVSPGVENTPRPGWQTEFFGSLFDWHEPDPDLLWRFKANLDNPIIRTNSAGFIGREISMPKADHTFRILLLGDSSPVGLGLSSHEQTFCVLLERLLDVLLADRGDVEVINASVSGYTSEQIRNLLDTRGWSYDPDLVIVYCGNNDASVSGMFSDQELLESQRMRRLRHYLGKSALYRMLSCMLTTTDDGEDLSAGELKVRVTPDRYEENLASIARDCRRRNCPLIVIKPPVPYLWPAGLQFKLFTHITGRDGQAILPDQMASILGRKLKYCLSRERFANLYGAGDIFTRGAYASAYDDSLAPEEAIAYYSRALSSQAHSPLLLNNLGVSYWQNRQHGEADRFLKEARQRYVAVYADSLSPAVVAAGSPVLYNIGVNLLSGEGDWQSVLENPASEAFAYLDSALQADYFSLRVKRAYWEKIDSLGSNPGVTVVDLPRMFAENGGEQLFIDHCHPTKEGHLLIAQKLAEIITELRR
jgi:lysophospholipase L1-like esterase